MKEKEADLQEIIASEIPFVDACIRTTGILLAAVKHIYEGGQSC